MIDRSIKLLLLVLLLACPWVVDSFGSDCDDPLGGGSCQNQDLNQGNDPPGGDECGGPIVVASASSSGPNLSVNLSNPGLSREQGYVVATVLLSGRQYRYVVSVSVEAKSGLSLTITFPGTITTISIQACSNEPGGINEGPDVVAIRHEEEPAE